MWHLKEKYTNAHYSLTPFWFRFKEDANTSPLYIKLIYDVVVKLRSYVTGEVLSLKLKDINSPVKCIRYIYTELMRKNGMCI